MIWTCRSFVVTCLRSNPIHGNPQKEDGFVRYEQFNKFGSTIPYFPVWTAKNKGNHSTKMWFDVVFRTSCGIMYIHLLQQSWFSGKWRSYVRKVTILLVIPPIVSPFSPGFFRGVPGTSWPNHQPLWPNHQPLWPNHQPLWPNHQPLWPTSQVPSLNLKPNSRSSALHLLLVGQASWWFGGGEGRLKRLKTV